MTVHHTVEPSKFQTVGTFFHLLADGVDIAFDDVVTAHRWAESRGLSAWTVTEQTIWREAR